MAVVIGKSEFGYYVYHSKFGYLHQDGKWAPIATSGKKKQKLTGHFETRELAQQAWEKAREKLIGEEETCEENKN